MHPNAELARELERCVSTSNTDLSHSGLRKQLIVQEGSGFVLTPKGKDFVAKWSKDYKPKSVAPRASVVTSPASAQQSVVREPARPAYSSNNRRDVPQSSSYADRSYHRQSDFRDTRSVSSGFDSRRQSSDQSMQPHVSTPDQASNQRQFGRAPQFSQQRRSNDSRPHGSREQFR